MSRSRDFRAFAMSGIALSALGFTGAALAQETETDEDVVVTTTETEAEAEQRQERVLVTGSLLRRSEFTSAAPIQVINVDTASLEGLISTAEIIQGSSIASGSFQLNNQFQGFVVEGGTGINSVSLRGLGAQRSLVLLDGQRPGPSGTRGQVGSFDLNVIPNSILQRVEILTDGASSTYGSDAVAGVVNIITRDDIDSLELNAQASVPFEGGGESYVLDAAWGFSNDDISFVVAGEYSLLERLEVGDRDYLACEQDFVFDPATGKRVDRENRSVTAGQGTDCQNIYINTVIEGFRPIRYVPSPDGTTIGPIPGYRPRTNAGYTADDNAFYEDVLEDPRYLSTTAINETERLSLYSNFSVDVNAIDAEWDTTLLYTKRETEAVGWRQFFPWIGSDVAAPFGLGYANAPDYENPLFLYRPVVLFPSNSEVSVDYYYVATELDGSFGNAGFLKGWNYTLSANYSYSDGEYTFPNAIFADQTDDAEFTDDAPSLNWLDPRILSGNFTDAELAEFSGPATGNTVYDQYNIKAIVTGEAFTLPAGPVGVALGVEYRSFSIDDQPSQAAQDGNLWGFTSAQVTKGEDSVTEVFGEIEVPILANQPFAESLVLNASARAFEYDSAGSDSVYKVGLNWQVTPTFRFRTTYGTSYRAPALYELFLGDQSSFAGQAAIDPCIDWGESQNENLRANCAAEGIPEDYTGVGSSATVFTGGGFGVLESETSEAQTFGVVWTPTFTDLSVAATYYEIDISDQVTSFGAGGIVSSCYTAEVYPNVFCSLLERAPAGDPSEFNILTVRDSFVNFNRQLNRGLDVDLRYDREFDAGTLIVDVGATWTFEDLQQAFSADTVSGIEDSDSNGTIGEPSITFDTQVTWETGDWTFSWFTDYVGRTSEDRFRSGPVRGYFGYPGGAYFKGFAEVTWYHDISARWEGDTLGVTVGIENLFDEHPPAISPDNDPTRGLTPTFATQYDLRGRSLFVQVNKTF